MAHGVGEVVNTDGSTIKMIQNNNHKQVNQQPLEQQTNSQTTKKNVGAMGSRRIFAASFKLKVLDSYRNDIDCRGNQRATARKYGIHRRQIQKWLQCEGHLRNSCGESNSTTTVTSTGCCTVPVGSGVATSPASSIDAQGEITTKADLTTTASSSGSPSSINSNSNNSNNNCNGITSIGVAGSVGTPIATPAPATPLPALNLSLARLHGDEQLQQVIHLPTGPPVPSFRQSGRCESSPTSLQYLHHNNNPHHHIGSPSSPNSVPLRNMLYAYAEYDSQQEALQRNHQRHRRRQQPNEHQRHDEEQREKLIKDSSSLPERKSPYVMNRTIANYDHNDIHSGTISNCSPNSEAYYQTLESYRNSAAFVALRVNNDNNNAKEIGLGGGASPSYQDKNNVESAGNVCEPPLPPTQPTSFASFSSPLVRHHTTTIKSERASPDSLATSGPCETPGSPETAASMPRARLNHNHNYQLNQQHQQQSLPQRLTDTSSDMCNTTDHFDVCTTNTKNNLVNRTSVAATAAAAIATASVTAAAAVAADVHSNETTSRLAHVHVSVDSHAPSTRDSENQQREREQQLHRNIVKVEYEERMGRNVKKEIVKREEADTTTSTRNTTTPMTMIMTTSTATREPKREISEEEALIERSRYHRERTTADVAAPCPDYQRATAAPVETSTDLSSGSCNDLVCPTAREPTGTYSGFSSPRTASSSGISTSSCSDSEIDPLDYSSSSTRTGTTDLSRRRSFSLRFKIDVLNAFHGDAEVAKNQRATARKFGINRRQVQKWLLQEGELRGETALRGGDLRQRLGPIAENTNAEAAAPVDLTTSATTNYPIVGVRSAADLEHSSSPLYCCDVRASPQKFIYYHRGSVAASPEIQPRTCMLPCCVEGPAAASTICYPESPIHRRSSSGYPESRSSLYCYSPRDLPEIGSGTEGFDVTMSTGTMKRPACSLSCCYEPPSSPKRMYLEPIEEQVSPACQDLPPQEAPLCLVKPKSCAGQSPVYSDQSFNNNEPIAPPAATPASNKGAILFKPYLDNPVSKPTDDTQLNYQPNQREHSPLVSQSVIVNNNNNCHGICNMNEDRSIVSNTQNDYALELSLRVPVTWQSHHRISGEFPERLRSAFVRYPTSPHYT